MNKKILVTQSSMPSLDEYIEEIKDLWDSHWLTNMGEKHKKLQSMLEDFLKIKHVLLFTNGHLALEGILEVLDLPKGGEIITTPFTFVSTTHSIVRTGYVPVFCDINDEDYTIDVNKIESLITEKTVAIMPVHVYGNVCDIESIDKIAKKHNLKVIYDAAHTFGETYKDISTACFGDASMFSFHATKVFNTIEGGAACVNDDKLAEKLNDIKNFGIHGPEECLYIGGNAKMSEFQAAMGICNLKHLSEEVEKRKIIFDLYKKLLSDIDGIKLWHEQHDVKHNYSYLPVIFDNYKYDRDTVYEKLKEHNIFARKYFYPLTNDFVCYKNFSTADVTKTPIAKYISDRVLTLPLYADLDYDVVKTICDLIKD